jgi:dipeptidyl-peptidase 4
VVDSFPRQYARTQRLTLGEPRDVTVSADGRRVVFLRSRGGDDAVNCLWVADAATGAERLVADPLELLADRDDHAELPPEERARRERQRESAGGITAYATDAAGTVAAFALGGRLFAAGLLSGTARQLDVAGPVFDPRPDPPARRIAYVSGRLLCLAELTGSWRVLAGGDLDEPDTVSWGSADFIAAEEMHRFRGYWWSPDGETIAVCRVDTAPVQTWHIADPAQPAQAPTTVRYPAAGTDNAEVSLHLFPIDGSEPVDVEWDRAAFPYLTAVQWTDGGLIISVQSRDQRRLEVLRVNVLTGGCDALFRDHDDAWVELVPGSPRLLDDGRLVVCADRNGARRLLVDGLAVTDADIQVRAIVAADTARSGDDRPGNDRVVFTANPMDDPTALHVWTWTPDGVIALTDGDATHTAAVGGPTVVVRRTDLETPGARWTLPGGQQLERFAETPLVTPSVTMLRTDSGMPVAVLLPHDHDGSPLPVLLDPYGGPHAQRVLRSYNAFCNSQWFADQGFAVVVADGRGTPGRGTEYERAVHGDLATAPLDDQIEALHHAAEHAAETSGVLDLDRVAIRGWSFGGYLAALAVMRRPDVFHAAVAGAPVTEWRLYDTHYTERYLGRPDLEPEAYDRSSLLPLAGQLERPLLLVHGLADDNVVAAHTLRLSAALLAAGRPHEVLPLVGVTHMTPQEVVAENLLVHQLDFLRRALGLATVGGGQHDADQDRDDR